MSICFWFFFKQKYFLFFYSDLPLAKFDYTQTCLKMDEDIVLELIKNEDVVRPFIRTVSFLRKFLRTSALRPVFQYS